MSHATEPEADAQADIPVYLESLGGSLIDAARISVMGAIALLPAPRAPLIITTDRPQPSDDPSASAQGCLEQAMNWLEAARVLTIDAGAPVTSLHVAGGR